MKESTPSIDRREFLRRIGRYCLAGTLFALFGIRAFRPGGAAACPDRGAECADCSRRSACGAAKKTTPERMHA
jgi:hypothetical protein